MTADQLSRYMVERYDDQCQWYDVKAVINKRWYYIFQTAVISLSAVTTVVVGVGAFSDAEWIQIAALVVAAAATASTGLIKVYRFQEQWIEYRGTAEILKRERHLFEARIGEYAAAPSPEQLFVSRVETHISRQNTVWVGRSADEGDQTGS